MDSLVIENNIVKKYTGKAGEEVIIPEGVVEIDSFAFMRPGLRRWEGPSKVTVAESVKKIGEGAFEGCIGLKKVILPHDLEVLPREVFSECISLEDIRMPKKIKRIEWGAFSYCEKIKKIELSDSIVEMGIFAFHNCEKLDTISVPEGVRIIKKGCFKGCYALKRVVLPESLKEVDEEAFEGCMSLKNIDIPTDVVEIGEGAFQGSGLACFKWPQNTPIIRNYTFWGSNLKEIELPNTIKSIESYAFCNTKISSISVPDSVESIGESAFQSDTNLKSVCLPSGLTKVSSYTFAECGNLEKVVLPNAVTSVEESAFSGCTSLKEVIISANIASIGERCFLGCSSLKKLNMKKNTQIGRDAFKGCVSMNGANNLFIMDNILFNCNEKLKSIDIPEGIIGCKMDFGSESKIERISLPKSMIELDLNCFCGVYQIEFYENTKIKDNAFQVYDEKNKPIPRGESHVIVLKNDDDSIKWKIYLGLERAKDIQRKTILDALFDNNVINIDGFDNCFKSVNNHFDKALIAIYRLDYPDGLTSGTRSVYEEYLKKNCVKAVKAFIDLGYLDGIKDISRFDVITQKNIKTIMKLALEEKNQDIILYLQDYAEKLGNDTSELSKSGSKDSLWEYTKTGKVVEFGSIEKNGLKHTLKWKIIEVQEDKMLLLSDESIAKKSFHTKGTIYKWKISEIRKWLNNDFMKSAFSKEELKHILPANNMTVTNVPFRGFKTKDPIEEETKDKVFLLSIKEVKKFLKTPEDRRLNDGKALSHWYLREGVLVSNGTAEKYRCSPSYEAEIRPAVYVKI